MRGKRYFHPTVLALALSAVTAFAQTPGTTPPASTARPYAPATTPPAVAATVNGEAIYEAAIQQPTLSNFPVPAQAEAHNRIIEEQVGQLLVDQSLRSAGYKVEPTEVDAKIKEMREELKKFKKDFDQMLKDYRITEAELRQLLTADLRWFKYADAQVNDKGLQELFTKSKDMFDGSAVQAWHILLTPPANDQNAINTAQAKLLQIKKNIETEVAAGLAKLPATTDKLKIEQERGKLLTESFAKYAKAESVCPTKARGGYVGWFQKVGFMTPPFADAAFTLQTNVVSNPVKTVVGYHLLLVSDRKAGKDVKFEEVKEVVKEVYLQRLHVSLVGQLRQRANVTINPPPK